MPWSSQIWIGVIRRVTTEDIMNITSWIWYVTSKTAFNSFETFLFCKIDDAARPGTTDVPNSQGQTGNVRVNNCVIMAVVVAVGAPNTIGVSRHMKVRLVQPVSNRLLRRQWSCGAIHRRINVMHFLLCLRCSENLSRSPFRWQGTLPQHRLLLVSLPALNKAILVDGLYALWAP